MSHNASLSYVRAIVGTGWGMPLMFAVLTAASIAADSCLAQLASSTAAIASSTPARWTPTGDLNTARVDHTATRLQDGRVLVVGGVGVGGVQVLDSAELYDPTTGRWSLTGRLRQVREGHTATLLTDGRVLVAGGCDVQRGLEYLCTTAELFDPATGTWSMTGHLWQPHYRAAATRLKDGKVLVVSGGSSGTDIYDPLTGAWTPAGRVIGEQTGFSVVLLPSGQVLTAGGGIQSGPDAGQAVGIAQIYDPVAGVWSRARDIGTRMGGPALMMLGDGNVLAVDGWASAVFDPSTGKWAAVKPMGFGRLAHKATLLTNGEVLAVGGWNWDAYQDVSIAEVYDPVGATWRSTASLNTARSNHTATLLADGRVLVAGGAGLREWNALASAELYEHGVLPILIGSGFTGAWYDPAQSGHGFMLEVLPGEPLRLLAGWFTFAPQGGQTWITGVGEIQNERAVVPVYRMVGSGGRFPPNFDAANVHQEPWGTLTFTFSDCNRGRVEWMSTAPGYGNGGFDLARLTLPAGLICSQGSTNAASNAPDPPR